jgi:hypothetical protein
MSAELYTTMHSRFERDERLIFIYFKKLRKVAKVKVIPLFDIRFCGDATSHGVSFSIPAC